MITPSATSPDLGRLLRGADPEADRDRDLRLRLGRGDQLGQLRRQLVPLAGGADGGDDVDEARARRRRCAARRSGERGRGDQRHQRQARRRRARRAIVLGLLERQVGDDRAGGPGRRGRPANSAAPPGRGPCSRRPSARPARGRRPTRRPPSAVSSVAPASSAAVAAAWIIGPSASGSENGTPSSIRSAPARHRPRRPPARSRGREAGHHVRHQSAARPSLAGAACEGGARDSPLQLPDAGRGMARRSLQLLLRRVIPELPWRMTSARSLSPRPERQSTS